MMRLAVLLLLLLASSTLALWIGAPAPPTWSWLRSIRSSSSLSCPLVAPQQFPPRRQRQRHAFVCMAMAKRPTTATNDDGDDDDDDDDDILDDVEDADWEPDETDLVDALEDLTLDDDDDDDEEEEEGDDEADDTAVLAADKDSDEDDDDDDDDVDLDIWDDDEDDEDDDNEEESVEEKEEEEELVEAYLGDEEDGEVDDWEDEGYAGMPLQDDPDDPDYMAQKKLVEEAVARREQVAKDDAFDPLDYIMNKMTKQEAEAIEKLDFSQRVEEVFNERLNLEVKDFDGMDIEKELEETPDLMYDDPYEETGSDNILGTGLSDADMKQLDESYKSIQQSLNAEPWDKVDLKDATTDWDNLPNNTLDEMQDCLEEIGGSSYNCTRWLLYDLDFNVSNLILAAVKHNREAPILFQHWFPQLMVYERYQHARDRNFEFGGDDVENADIKELERYYYGFGYEEIPTKAPAETGIISLEDMDEEEIKMAAFENWMTEVYNPADDKKDFDDDDIRDEDNVFSEYYEAPQHPDLPAFEDADEDISRWEEEMGDEEKTREFRDHLGKRIAYKYVEDKEFEQEFRGHLIVACSPLDSDLEIAEKLTERFATEFGKQVYVETRVMAHAREEDNCFEIWLESYDIDLLHSKKRAMAGVDGWFGPAECDDAEIESLVEKVRFLISDDARYSFRYDLELTG